MSRQPMMSVVVPARNEAAVIDETLRSLCNQRVPFPVEIIVVDNGSHDETAARAAAWGVRVIHEARPGVAQARQAGFMAARGTIIATTDADTIVPEDWLADISYIFSNHTDIVAVGGPVRYAFKELYIQELFNRAIPLLHELDRRVHGGAAHLVGANLAVRRQAFQQIGGFRTELLRGEDMDLAHRLAAVGRIHFASELRVTTSDRRFRADGPQALVRYFQNYLEITRPDAALRKQVVELIDDLHRKVRREDRR